MLPAAITATGLAVAWSNFRVAASGLAWLAPKYRCRHSVRWNHAMGQSNSPSEDRPDPSEVRRHLQRILASAEFSSASRLQQFLAFVGEEKLQGAETIKETEIAIRVFHRQPSFDPSGDSLAWQRATCAIGSAPTI
jgi:hypothetical protein